MQVHQFLSKAHKVLAAIPVMVVLLAGMPSAMAQLAPTQIATPTSVVNVVITGTVPGPPEDVAFNRVQVQLTSALAKDPDPALPPKLIVGMNFIKVAGVGVSTKIKFIADAKVTKVRPVSNKVVLQITFPFEEDNLLTTSAVATRVVSAARAGLATFNITVDNNGVITGATGTIGANTFTP